MNSICWALLFFPMILTTVDYCTWRRMTFPGSPLSGPEMPLEFGVFLPSIPFFDHNGTVLISDSLQPVISLALNDIARHDCVLKGYRLQVQVKDTHCKAALGTKAFFELMKKRPTQVAVLGDVCTTVNKPVAMTAKYWHVVQLSYAETHPMFGGSTQITYPTFYRIVPGGRNLHQARCRFLARFNWTRVGTIMQSDKPRYALWHETLMNKLVSEYNVNVVYTAGVSGEELGNIGPKLDALKQMDARILVGDLDSNFAVEIMCEAQKRRMIGDGYVWILPGYQNPQWWLHNGHKLHNCSIDTLVSALDGHFSMHFASVRPDLQVPTFGGRTVDTYRTVLDAICSIDLNCSLDNDFHAYTYDSVWTLALALDQLMANHEKRFNTRWSPRLLDRDPQERLRFATFFLDALNRTSFAGLTGQVEFANNERLGVISISFFRNGTYHLVGHYDGVNDFLTIDEDLLSALSKMFWVTFSNVNMSLTPPF